MRTILIGYSINYNILILIIGRSCEQKLIGVMNAVGSNESWFRYVREAIFTVRLLEQTPKTLHFSLHMYATLWRRPSLCSSHISFSSESAGQNQPK